MTAVVALILFAAVALVAGTLVVVRRDTFVAPRRWAAFRAGFGGWFWLACPLCGRCHAGYEWRDRCGLPSSIPTDQRGISQAICPHCTLNGYGVDVVDQIR